MLRAKDGPHTRHSELLDYAGLFVKMLQALGCGQHNSVIELGRITEGKPNESPQGRNYRAFTALADGPEEDAGHLHLAFLPARRRVRSPAAPSA